MSKQFMSKQFMFNNLPEEIITEIYKQYYSKYVMNDILPKCFRNYRIGGISTKKFHCNFRTIDSAFCLCCHHEFQKSFK